MLKSSLSYSSLSFNSYIPMKLVKTITGEPVTTESTAIEADKKNKELIFKICAPFTDCISEINSTLVDNIKDLDVVMLMYNLIKYNSNYSKSFGSLWQCYRDEPGDTAKANSESLKSKIWIIGSTPAVGNTKDVEIAVPINILEWFLKNSWNATNQLQN